MAKSKNKNLTTKTVKKEHSTVYTRSKVEIHGEVESYDLYVDDVFSTVKVNELVSELLKNLKFMQFNKIGMPHELINMYLLLLCVRKFTSLDIPDDVNAQFQVFDQLVSLGMFNQIVEKFPQEELMKVYESIAGSVEKMEGFNDAFTEALEDIEFENQEVVDVVLGGQGKVTTS